MVSVEENPNIKKCENGHYYEVKKHEECPYCKSEYKEKNSRVVVRTIASKRRRKKERTELIFKD